MGLTQVPILVQSSPNREKAMKESKLAILLLCLGCFLPINKVQGDCAEYIKIYNYVDHKYMGFYAKTSKFKSRGRPVWRLNKDGKRKDYCLWFDISNYWWVGPCRQVGSNSGLAYLENRARCPYDPYRKQVKHVEHQAVEKLRCGDEEGVMKDILLGTGESAIQRACG